MLARQCPATATDGALQLSTCTAGPCHRPLPSRLQQVARCSWSLPLGGAGSRGAYGSSSRRRPAPRAAQAAETEVSSEAQPASLGPKDVPKASVWELDFCSRPILDERGKKVWELLICDSTRDFEFSQYFPNNKINSVQLKKALGEILAREGAVKPEAVRFFRGQMNTIITTALTDLEIKPLPSRRCFTLMDWLAERAEQVYRAAPGFTEGSSTLFTLDLASPQDLPDALRGESWEFVQLPLGALLAEAEACSRANVFGSRFDLALVGAAGLPEDTPVPGVVVFSRRALPMAAWTNGLELAALKADVDRACLILETGVNARWRYGAYRRSPEASAEAMAWEEAKAGSKGIHFLAVQQDEESDVSGLWMLLDKEPPTI